MRSWRSLQLLLPIIVFPFLVKSQVVSDEERDPCGYPELFTPSAVAMAMGNWGYGYDSLLVDLNRWRTSPFVSIDSIGTSVLQRTLFRLTIQDTASPPTPRTRIWIHARTHPGEVQSTHVTNQLIVQLLEDNALARAVRSHCVFHLLPMYNPDGVELGYARENAHMVDIESNWTAVPGEPEVQALRGQFLKLMATPNPIVIALNMHSALACKRYFVYHAESGTSASYAANEQRFINCVRAGFPDGIQPYSYYVSWTSGPSLVYPESWFWLNHGASVLALTYEDMNCSSAGAFDTTAKAILSGIAAYLGISTGIAAENESRGIPQTTVLDQNYPNPFNPSTTLDYRLSTRGAVKLSVVDLLGREVATLVNESQEAGSYRVVWNAETCPSGVYIARLSVGESMKITKMTLLR